MAKCKIAIRGYTSDITKNSLASEKISLASLYTRELQSLLEPPEGHHPRVLALKNLRNMGGIDCVGELIALPKEELPWLPVKREMAANTELSVLDPFPWLKSKEEYEAVCGAVRSCATQSNRNTTQLDKLGLDVHGPLLAAAIFSQTVLERRSLFNTGIQALTDWVGKYTNKNAANEASVYNWLCNGCTPFSNSLEIEKSIKGVCQLQLAVNLSIWGIQQNDSWLYAMLFQSQIRNKRQMKQQTNHKASTSPRLS